MAKYVLAPAKISPLLQPKVDTMIATAMKIVPTPGSAASSVAVATRSADAC